MTSSSSCWVKTGNTYDMSPVHWTTELSSILQSLWTCQANELQTTWTTKQLHLCFFCHVWLSTSQTKHSQSILSQFSLSICEKTTQKTLQTYSPIQERQAPANPSVLTCVAATKLVSTFVFNVTMFKLANKWLYFISFFNEIGILRR